MSRVCAGSVFCDMSTPRYLSGGSDWKSSSGRNNSLCRAIHEKFWFHQGKVSGLVGKSSSQILTPMCVCTVWCAFYRNLRNTAKDQSAWKCFNVLSFLIFRILVSPLRQHRKCWRTLKLHAAGSASTGCHLRGQPGKKTLLSKINEKPVAWLCLCVLCTLMHFTG